MNIYRTFNNAELIIALEGRLDTLTAPQLESELESMPIGVETLVLDLKELEYISSAGLRVLLKAHKSMADRGGMKVINVNETVEEIFSITGFDTVLTIE